MRHMSVFALLTAATLVQAASAAAAPGTAAPPARTAASVAASTGDAVRAGVVRGLSVVQAADRTEIVIAIDGNVGYRDMLLEGPARLVIDFEGAQHGGGLERFDGVNRGGVRHLRVAQFSPSVVRVVVELDGPIRYRLERASGELRVSFPNPVGSFEPWSTMATGPAILAARDPYAQQAAARAQPQPAPEAPRAPQRQQRPPFTVTFIDQPLAEVLSTIGDYAGRTIIAAQDVRGRVITAEVRQQPWDLALEAILQANSLAVREHPESGILIVEDLAKIAERVRDEPMVMRQFTIQHISADSLAGAVRGMLTDGKGRVTVNGPSNTLLVTDVPSVLDQLGPMIRQLDVRPLQVNISATIAFIDRTALEAFGVTYDVKDSRGNQLNRQTSGYLDGNRDGVFTESEATSQNVVLLGGNSIAALANANFRVPSPALELVTSLVLGRHTLISFIEALQTVSLSDIQAKPVVQTTNHQQAVIQVGESTPIRVLDAGGQGGQGGAGGGGGGGPQATVTFRDTGIILRVTPHVTGDQIRLDLHAERSNIALAPSDIGVTFATQMANTQVIVRDGETTVIGGLTISEKSRVRTGIPLLMDLPLVGALFRNTSERENKRDLLIMVTPHIVH
jgi:type IV pilus assembly protein PilQ